MKVAVIYASTTGNTEMMANAICEAVKESGAELLSGMADSSDAVAVTSCDVILLGSPAMGDEVLEDSMEEFYSSIENSLNGKKTGIFGSYDWGDGQWLRDWEDRIKKAGGIIASSPLMINLTPDADGIENCKAWAREIIK